MVEVSLEHSRFLLILGHFILVKWLVVVMLRFTQYLITRLLVVL